MERRVTVRPDVGVMTWDRGVILWIWAFVVASAVTAGPGLAQPSTQSSPVPGLQGPAQGAAPQQQLPEVIRPGPLPKNGVITPPSNSTANTPVIKPPLSGTMPVIPPPGSAGGPRAVVPK